MVLSFFSFSDLVLFAGLHKFETFSLDLAFVDLLGGFLLLGSLFGVSLVLSSKFGKSQLVIDFFFNNFFLLLFFNGVFTLKILTEIVFVTSPVSTSTSFFLDGSFVTDSGSGVLVKRVGFVGDTLVLFLSILGVLIVTSSFLVFFGLVSSTVANGGILSLSGTGGSGSLVSSG